MWQAKIIKWIEEGEKRGILSETDVEELKRLLKKFEEEGRLTTIHPMLYKGILRDALDELPRTIKGVKGDIESGVVNLLRERIDIIDVNVKDELRGMNFLGSDASSYPLPLQAMRVAVIGGIAITLGHEDSPTLLWDKPIIFPRNEIGRREFKFLYQSKAEKLIPLATIDQLEKYDDVEGVIIDGPLSDSLLLRRVPIGSRRSREIQRKIKRILQGSANELVDARDQLIRYCYKKDIPVIGVVKEPTARHFHHYYEIESKYTDAFVFHQILKYGQRTNSISISKAIDKITDIPSRLSCEIYGFFIKTSINPLTHPIRVEYPAYMKDEEDWIASYVLSTAIQSFYPKYDGIPKVQCMADRYTRITRRVMMGIYERVILRTLREERLNIELLSLKRGYWWM